ncbi:MAG: hypothetical protein AMXMBFR61_19770 [Fimbriimonadales bacterium]
MLQCIVLVVSTSASFGVIYVSPTGSDQGGGTWATAFTTIGQAVAAAPSGSEIWVRQGVYYENVVIQTAGLRIYGGFYGDESLLEERHGESTVIDGANLGRPVRVNYVADVLLDRLTLRNGRATGFGGALYAASANNLTLTNCVLEDCTSSTNNSGGGIYASNGSITITDTIIRRCTTADIGGGMRAVGADVFLTGVVFEDNVASKGGGLALEGGVGYVRSCVFRRNIATCGGLEGGGGAWLRTVQQVQIERNWFTENQANAGAALDLLNRTNTKVYANLITRNTAGTAAVLVRNSGTWPRLINNTYSDNVSTVGNSVMYFYDQASGTIRNENITFNTGPDAAVGRDASASYYWSYGNFYMNSVAPFSNPQDLNAAGPTTTQVDPRYVNRLYLDIPWSYNLRPDSLVRDYGYVEVQFDYCGAPRPVDSSGYGTPYPDKGCYEYQAVSQYVAMPSWRGPQGDGDQSAALLRIRAQDGNGRLVLDDWVPQSESGFYTLPGDVFAPQSGPWTIRISAKGYLIRKLEIPALPAHGCTGLNVVLIPGDANGDNRVDLQDLNVIMSTFGATGPMPGDINGDLSVDVPDMSTVLANFGALGD